MQTNVLQSSYAGGMVQDVPRHQLPTGAVWSLIDFLTDVGGAPLAKRGGWGKTASAGANLISVGVSAISGTTKIHAVDVSGNVLVYTGSGWTTLLGATAATTQHSRPVSFNSKLIVFGATHAISSDGTAVTSLAASPAAKYGVAYKQRLVLADDTKLYFSDVIDETTWDVDSFIQPTVSLITGLAALPNMIAIFAPNSCERLRGSTPPSTNSAGDMALEPAFEEGCIDARSIVVWNDQMIWANENGVHISDGAAIQNLIEKGGLKQYWHTLLSGYDSSTWTIAGGIHRGNYVVTVKNGSGSTTLICNIGSKTWKIFSNFGAAMYAESADTSSELYMAMPAHPYLGLASPCFDLTGASTDGDGTAVKPSVELPFFRLGTERSRWREIYVGVDFQTGVGDTGVLQVSYTTQPDGDASYTTLVDDSGNPVTIAGQSTDGLVRVRLPLHLDANGIGLKIAQITGTSQETALFDIEATVRGREGRY